MAPFSRKSVAILFLKDLKSSASFVLETGVWSGVGGKTEPGKVAPIELGAGRLNPCSESVRGKRKQEVNTLSSRQ